MKAGEIKILKDGNRTTYILARENENIPLLTVENGEIRIEKERVSSPQVALMLASVLKHAVLAETATLTEEEWKELERFWAEEYDVWNTSKSGLQERNLNTRKHL